MKEMSDHIKPAWLHIGGDLALESSGMCYCEGSVTAFFAEQPTNLLPMVMGASRHLVVSRLFDISDDDKPAFYAKTVRRPDSFGGKSECTLGYSIPERALIESFYVLLHGRDHFKLQKRFDPAMMDLQTSVLKDLLNHCADSRTVRLVLEFLINYPVDSVDLEDILFDETCCLYYGETYLRKLTINDWDFYDGYWPVLLSTEGDNNVL